MDENTNITMENNINDNKDISNLNNNTDTDTNDDKKYISTENIAYKLYVQLENLKSELSKAFMTLSKKSLEFSIKYPEYYINILRNPPDGMKTTADNVKNATLNEISEYYMAKKELEMTLDKINIEINLIKEEVDLLNYF